MRFYQFWQSQWGSNPCRQNENLVSWTTRRWDHNAAYCIVLFDFCNQNHHRQNCFFDFYHVEFGCIVWYNIGKEGFVLYEQKNIIFYYIGLCLCDC